MQSKETMRAVLVERYGGPEVLGLRTVPRPLPADGEVRVKIHATTVTRTDTATLRAHPFFARAATGLLRPRMRTLGLDFAGEIDLVGGASRGFDIGDRVFGISPHRFGTHAEYVCVPADGAMARIPHGFSYDQAVVGEGAWYANATTRHLTPGKRCLIYGASGAIGTAALQLAKSRGAEVVAVVGTRHVELANALGADRVLNYETGNFTALGETFDLVFDAVGKTSYFECRRLLTPAGVYSATDLGPGWSNILLGMLFGLTGSRRVRVPFPEPAPAFIDALANLMSRGVFHGVFDRSYALADIADAFRYVETGRKTGIVTIGIR